MADPRAQGLDRDPEPRRRDAARGPRRSWRWCWDTLAEQSFRDFEVIVADNGSSDDSVAYLSEDWPEASVVELGENRGFSAAVNAGVAAGRGAYVALLNTDIELSPDWLELLVGELDRDSRLGFATGKVMRYDDRDVIEQAGHDFFTCGRFEPRGLDERDEGQYDERRATPIVTAAAALYRREALEEAGGFDEDYFLYCEDGDVCLRMLLPATPASTCPSRRPSTSAAGRSAPPQDLPRFYLVRNALITLLKDLPASVLLRSLPKIALYEWGQLSAGRREGYVRTVLRAYASFLRIGPGDPAQAARRPARQDGRARRVRGLSPDGLPAAPAGWDDFSDGDRGRPDPLPAPGADRAGLRADPRGAPGEAVRDRRRAAARATPRMSGCARAGAGGGRGVDWPLRGGPRLRRREPRVEAQDPERARPGLRAGRARRSSSRTTACRIPRFFPYCEELLERYRDDERVIHISGSQLLPEPPTKWSYHFSRGPAIWGWATWRRAWRLFDVELTDWHAKSRAERKARLRRDVRGGGRAAPLGLRLGQLARDRQLGRPVVLRRTEPRAAQRSTRTAT